MEMHLNDLADFGCFFVWLFGLYVDSLLFWIDACFLCTCVLFFLGGGGGGYICVFVDSFWHCPNVCCDMLPVDSFWHCPNMWCGYSDMLTVDSFWHCPDACSGYSDMSPVDSFWHCPDACSGYSDMSPVDSYWHCPDVCCGYSDGLVLSDRQKELMAAWDHINMKPFHCFKLHSHKESLPKYLKNIHRKRKKIRWQGWVGDEDQSQIFRAKKENQIWGDHTVSNIHNQKKKKKKIRLWWGGGGGGEREVPQTLVSDSCSCKC